MNRSGKIRAVAMAWTLALVVWAAVAVGQAPVKNAEESPGGNGLALPLHIGKHVGDLDEMVKRNEIRVLVVYSQSGFFYNAGRPEGIFYETFENFERFVNEKVRSGKLKINVTFLPVRPDGLEQALMRGEGDIIGFPVIVTPEREKEALFTTPVDKNLKEVVVRGPKSARMQTADDLSGEQVFVNPLTAYKEDLQKLSDALVKKGKAPIAIRDADPNLSDEDLIEMTAAGLIPTTVTLDVRARFWAKVFPKLESNPEIVVKDEGQIGFVTRKDSPKLMALLDEFVKTRAAGTSFGNTLLRRYMQDTGWVKNSTSTEEMKKFRAYVRYFQEYAKEYDFDYLMLVAQGYQESRLNQDATNPSGAVGIMQVIPKYAEAPPISVPNVRLAKGNIEAGTKMLRNIVDTYLNDPKLDPMNKTLFAFASYNAGPNRIAGLRKKAAAEGLDGNQWFGNVELVAAREIGQQTVQYVNNIYKYYVAYKLVLEETK